MTIIKFFDQPEMNYQMKESKYFWSQLLAMEMEFQITLVNINQEIIDEPLLGTIHEWSV